MKHIPVPPAVGSQSLLFSSVSAALSVSPTTTPNIPHNRRHPLQLNGQQDLVLTCLVLRKSACLKNDVLDQIPRFWMPRAITLAVSPNTAPPMMLASIDILVGFWWTGTESGKAVAKYAPNNGRPSKVVDQHDALSSIFELFISIHLIHAVYCLQLHTIYVSRISILQDLSWTQQRNWQPENRKRMKVILHSRLGR